MFTPQRDRQGGGYRPVRPPSALRLLLALALVFLAIWYLSRFAG
jgi:hypothetical protein